MNPAIPVFHENAVLFGYAATPRVVAFELAGDHQVRILARDRDGGTITEVKEFRPFLLLASTDLLAGWSGGYDVETLQGDGQYRFVAYFRGWSDALKARAHLQKTTGLAPSAPGSPFLFLSDPIQQYLMHHRPNPLSGPRVRRLRRTQLDIETYCTAGYEFPNPARAEDRITAIALSDSTGWEHVISGKALDEPDMLRELVRIVVLHGRLDDVNSSITPPLGHKCAHSVGTARATHGPTSHAPQHHYGTMGEQEITLCTLVP